MPKTSVEYVKQKVPAFLQRFKAETGYQEHQIEDKQGDVERAEGLEDRADERPQVVQLSKNDLTADEAAQLWEEEKKEKKKTEESGEKEVTEEEEPSPENKLLFKKPTKRPSNELQFNINNKKVKVKKDKKDTHKKGVKNAKLLSFDQEDEEG